MAERVCVGGGDKDVARRESVGDRQVDIGGWMVETASSKAKRGYSLDPENKTNTRVFESVDFLCVTHTHKTH